MAWVTGTATDHNDLLLKLESFLTTNTDLVNAGEDWEVIWSRPLSQDTPSADPSLRDLFVKGPGRPGANPVFLRFYTWGVSNVDSIHYMVGAGCIDYLGGVSFYDQPGSDSSYRRNLTLWDQSMTYWFIANGARIMIVVQVGSYFMFGHYGHIIPYGAPSEMPHPILIGGNAGVQSLRFSSESLHDGLSAYYVGTSNMSLITSKWTYRAPDGPWRYWIGSINDTFLESELAATFNLTTDPIDARFLVDTTYDDEQLVLVPVELFTGQTGLTHHDAVHGVLEGVYKISPTLPLTAGSTLTQNGKTYLIFNNVFRTSFGNFACVELL